MNYKKVKGHKLNVGISGHDPFALGKSCTLEIRLNFAESVNPTSGGWKRYVAQAAEWSVSCSGLYSLMGKELAEMQVQRKPVQIDFYDTQNEVSYSGEAWIESLQFTGAVKEISTYQVKLKGNGPLNVDA